jgi:hypothetical protein
MAPGERNAGKRSAAVSRLVFMEVGVAIRPRPGKQFEKSSPYGARQDSGSSAERARKV